MRKKRFMGTFLTEEEYRVLTALLKYDRLSDAARALGKAQPTVSIIKKRVEEKIRMALETVRLALILGVISKEDVLDVVNSVEARGELSSLRGEHLLERYLSIFTEATSPTIKRSVPGLLEILGAYYVRFEEERLRAAKTPATDELSRLLSGRIHPEQHVTA